MGAHRPREVRPADDMVTKLEDAIAKIEADLAAAQAPGTRSWPRTSPRTSSPARPSSRWPRRAADRLLGLTASLRWCFEAQAADTSRIATRTLPWLRCEDAGATAAKSRRSGATPAAAATPRAAGRTSCGRPTSTASRTRRSSIGKPAAPSTSQHPRVGHDEVVVDGLEDQVGRTVAGDPGQRRALRRLVVGGDGAERRRRGPGGRSSSFEVVLGRVHRHDPVEAADGADRELLDHREARVRGCR